MHASVLNFQCTWQCTSCTCQYSYVSQACADIAKVLSICSLVSWLSPLSQIYSIFNYSLHNEVYNSFGGLWVYYCCTSSGSNANQYCKGINIGRNWRGTEVSSAVILVQFVVTSVIDPVDHIAWLNLQWNCNKVGRQEKNTYSWKNLVSGLYCPH